MRAVSMMTIAAFVALASATLPLEAQGKGKGQDKTKDNRRGSDMRGARAERAVRGNQDRKEAKDLQKDIRKAQREDARAARRVVRDVGGAVALPGAARVGRGSDSDSDSDSDRGRRNRFNRVVFIDDIRPSIRHFVVVDRVPQRVVAGAVSRAHLRGVDDDALVIRPAGDRVHLLNRAGVLLLDLDENRARSVGRWEAIPLDDRVRDGAPAFCRSGEGHPVFGRDWCIEKGFGLGSTGNLRWARAPLEDVVFVRRVNGNRIQADGLLGMLGATAFDRLALHAITLGLLEPLTGMWLDDPSGPRVLLVNSGSMPVAEIVDRNRDDRPEVLLVTRRDW